LQQARDAGDHAEWCVMEPLRIEALCGAQIGRRLGVLAELRIEVFRDWPYLYEGSREYEAHYLDVYLRSPRSLAVLIWDDERCVGASTALPLADAPADVQAPFLTNGYELDSIDYFGESVLQRAYRGRGLGVRFFEARERHARAQGLSLCTFCAVERPDDHPQKPREHRSNDQFWRHRGYRRMNDLQTQFSWRDVGATETTTKVMTFWSKECGA
jgi:GNAT superfamily N-acetyltransferase